MPMETEAINAEIGRKIKNLRNRNGLTQQELADRAEELGGGVGFRRRS